MGEQRGIKKELAGLKTAVSLKDYTSYRIGGRAKYFFEAKTKEDLSKAIAMAKKFNLPFFILGRGSNILVADKGYHGLIIKIQNVDYQVVEERITADSGAPLYLLLRKSIENGLSGLEWAAGIPGTIGGAIYGNTGAFGDSMASIVRSVTVYDLESGEIKKIKRKECEFCYKESIFKKKKNLIILSCELKFKKDDKKEIMERTKKHLKYRREKQPFDFPSAGSIFKNHEIKRIRIVRKRLLKKFPEIKEFIRQRKQIPAGFLIEKCGLKGKKSGNAQISEKHANFIINLGEAKAKDVLCLIRMAKRCVKRKFKIELKEEIQYLGF
ncbi:MAG: UDP-N-acetylmuramate dehydrogenase [bacterium]